MCGYDKKHVIQTGKTFSHTRGYDKCIPLPANRQREPLRGYEN